MRDFETQWKDRASEETKIRLVARYQKLDDIVTEVMLNAANSVGRKNHGYQRSGELITAAYKLCFWRAVLSCKKRKNKIHKESERTSRET